MLRDIAASEHGSTMLTIGTLAIQRNNDRKVMIVYDMLSLV